MPQSNAPAMKLAAGRDWGDLGNFTLAIGQAASLVEDVEGS